MRKYLPTVAELIDRLSIIQLKEVFITEHKEEYAKEIKDIVHDLNELMNWEKPSGEMVRAIIVLSQMNLHIWHNETKYRAGEGDGNLGLTHGLNGIRNTAKNIIQDQLEDGGKLIFIRHAYAPGNGDPNNFNLNDCSTQRNLNSNGRKQAKEIGKFFKENKIQIYKVL